MCSASVRRWKGNNLDRRSRREKHGGGMGQWNAHRHKERKMPKHDHHKAAGHHEDAAKSHRQAAEAHEKGDTEQATQHSQIANEHSSKANEASNTAHQKSKGPKNL
jgi:hypothetical protein